MNTTPAFQKCYDLYKNLYLDLRQISKHDRYTWGERCETVAMNLLQTIGRAEFLQRAQKRIALIQISEQLDFLKILLRLGYDLRILDQKKLIARQGELQELGKMIGGWLKSV